MTIMGQQITSLVQSVAQVQAFLHTQNLARSQRHPITINVGDDETYTIPRVPAPNPPPVPMATVKALVPVAAPDTAPALNNPPILTGLMKAHTVMEAWSEWKDGRLGQPAIRDLEERWGSRWRPSNIIRVQFCRRKVIWDAVLNAITRGKSEEDAIEEVEQLRAGQSLNKLVDRLKQRRRHRD